MANKINRMLFLFCMQLSIILLISYLLQHMFYIKMHVKVINLQLILSYIINGSLSVFIFSTMVLLKGKYKDQLGFIYLIGSFIKYTVFFVVLYPIYKEDGTVSKIEFSIFFVPYIVSLTYKIIALVKILNLNKY